MKKIAFIKSFALLTLAWLMLCSFKSVTDEDMLSSGYTAEELEALKEDTIAGQTGVVEFTSCHARIMVPTDLVYLDRPQAMKLLTEYWDNSESNLENMLGVLVPSENRCFYQVSTAYVISYNDCGYIKDDDAEKVDYDELLEQLQEDEKEENESLPVEQRSVTKGWTVTPHYDRSNHALVWAKTLSFAYGDVVNYDMRVLGKDGLVSVNAVADLEAVDEVVSKESAMIGSVRFDEGYAYADFDPIRDRVSDWTIGGLVAGSILAKSGFFAKLGVLLLKFWKIIAVGVVAIAAGIKKIFGSKKA